ncbi:MAG TPA: shikimate dehydrogenase [Acidimicrobiales bacterium]|nr:shikimate dehydrogenase [Acidimicrobiales bacterium]
MLTGEGGRATHGGHSGRPLRTWPTASTVLAGVIGDPVEHSLSPALHNAALVDLGLDWAYVAFPVAAGHGEAAVAAMAELGIRGLSVTMPHKAAAARACHRLSPVAERLGVVNTVTNFGGYLMGDSTDGPGFIDALADQGWAPAGKRCLVLGAGGAARAVVVALAESGAGRVEIVARRAEQARDVATLAGPVGAVGSVDAADEADLLVNATPVGMTGVEGEPAKMDPAEGGRPQGDPVTADRAEGDRVKGDRAGDLPFGLDPKRLGPGQMVVDLIYAPATTNLLAEARARGAETCNGLGMLIYQAARQVRIWTGRGPSVEVMSAAAIRELGKRAEHGTLADLPQLREPGGPS